LLGEYPLNVLGAWADIDTMLCMQYLRWRSYLPINAIHLFCIYVIGNTQCAANCLYGGYIRCYKGMHCIRYAVAIRYLEKPTYLKFSQVLITESNIRTNIVS